MLWYLIKLVCYIPVAFIKNLFYPSVEAPCYGMRGYVGLAGHGKTYSAVREVLYLKQKHPELAVISNIDIEGVDVIELKSLDDLVKDYPQGAVVLIDELPTLFSSRAWKNFPPELLGKLTQLRKNHGMRILYTAQRSNLIEKSIRILSDDVVTTSTLFHWLTINIAFYGCDIDDDYGVEKNAGVTPKWLDCFLQTKAIRECYNSFTSVEKLDLTEGDK